MDNSNKLLGYFLITLGIVAILFSLFSVYSVFTGKQQPYNLFSFNGISMDMSKFVEGAPTNANLTQELIASDMLNKPTNVLFHLLLMGFVSTIGLKLATIGTQLVRTIKVNLKEERSVLFPPR